MENPNEATLNSVASDTSNPDTFGLRFVFSGEYVSYGENEVRCRKVELQPGITVSPAKDWANPGSQSKTKFGP